MKKLFMLLAVVALTSTYSFAQNANSGIQVIKNGNNVTIWDDCGVEYSATSSNLVLMANGFIKYTGIFDISESCEQYDKATKFTGNGFVINVTPSGIATVKYIFHPNQQ